MGKQVDKNDFWFIENNPITKVGVYPYLGKQISQDCEPDKIYYVLRPKEELFRKETLDSLRLIPLIDGHTMIGKDFTAPEDKGLDGTLGDNVSHDTDTIYNDLKIISNKMKEEIQNGKKELSLGYFCRYDKQPGTYKGQRYDYVQRDIIANHLALVDKGRMGTDVRVYDSKNIPEGEAFAMDSIDIAIDKDEDIEWITVRGTHVPIKKGESKEQAVKNFLESKKSSSGIKGSSEKLFHKGEIVTPEQSEAQFKEDDFVKTPKGVAKISQIVRGKLSDTPYYKVTFEDGKTATYLEEELEPDTEQSGSKAESGKNELNKEKLSKMKDLLDKTGGDYEFAKSQMKSDADVDKMISNLEEEVKKQEAKMNAPEKVLPKTFEKGDIMHSKKLNRNYAYMGKNKDGLYIFVDNDKFIKNDITDDDVWLVSEKYLKNNLADGNMTLAENRSGYEKSEPEGKKTEKNKYKNNKINGWSSPNTAKKVETLKKILQKPITATEAKDKLYDILGNDDLYDKLDDMEERYPKKDVRNIIEEFISDNEISLDSSIEEYKTIQGEGKMADKKEKVAIDEDKRKLIDEIGGILKEAGLDDEIIRTVIGKAEKIAYNKSEAGDEGEEVEEEVIEEENEEKDKKPAKDKCGKDEEGKKVEEKDKEEEEKKKVVKAFAQKEKLGKEVEDALGTFDHSEMTELEIAKYACDKLDLEVEKGQEISAVKGYLKGLAKAPKATFGYKTVAADSGIQKEDAEFEKFVNKGE